MMSGGLFLVGTDRGVGKTSIGIGIVSILRALGVDATMLTPISTGGSIEKVTEQLRRVGVREPRHLLYPVTFETLASPYVASRFEGKEVDLALIQEAYRELRRRDKFVVVEGGGVMVPIARHYAMVDLLREFDLPSLIIGRTGRGTLNHCLLTLRMLLVMGLPPLGFVLNGFGQFGDGFAEALNPDALRELAAPTPVVATLEWRPEYQDNLPAFTRMLGQQDDLVTLLKQLVRHEPASSSPVTSF